MYSATFRSSPLPRRRRGAAAGFTLIEVLVAIIVLSFGVLGAVGLQAAALQANREARYQSSAARLVRELGDLMRSNVTVSSQTTAGANPYLVSSTTPVPTTASCFTASCTAAGVTEIAKFQMNDWLSRLGTELPGVRVVVCYDSTPYTGSVPHWSCDNSGTVVVAKLGWTRQSYNRTDAAASAVLLASVDTNAPNVVIPMIPSSQ